MARVNLKMEQYGAQFDAFVEFAKQHEDNPGFVAQINGKTPGKGSLFDSTGKPRQISAKKWDGAGNPLHYFGSSKTVNNEVRNLFKQTLFNLFDISSVESLPTSIRAVLKENDFDNSGRPLTARRILAVTNAVIAEAARDPTLSEYIHDFPERNTRDAFRAFIMAKHDALDDMIGGPPRQQYDVALAGIFKAVGSDAKRGILAELIAAGKIEVPIVDGKLPDKAGLDEIARNAKKIVDFIVKVPQGNLRKVVIGTMKAMPGTINADDLYRLNAEKRHELAEAASGVDTSRLSFMAKSCAATEDKLEAFGKSALDVFDKNVADPKDSALMASIKKGMFLYYALREIQNKVGDNGEERARAIHKRFAQELNEHYELIVSRSNWEDFLNSLAVPLEIISGEHVKPVPVPEPERGENVIEVKNETKLRNRPDRAMGNRLRY